MHVRRQYDPGSDDLVAHNGQAQAAPTMVLQSTIDKYANIATANTSGSGSAETLGYCQPSQPRDILDAKIGVVGSDVTLLCQDLKKPVELITAGETRVSNIEDSIETLQKKVNWLHM
ncbi:hypothetical protein NDU88_002497 [Pleurodeles waltl]|uniref:Uncharacterized protein n=1 Tax=Pleurodeles waltl TaxID=8319 RepID=A0AAV7RCW4_PLEWA|nr:hypothetical protein NDU88_002497 [Pleurodeles waltl]